MIRKATTQDIDSIMGLLVQVNEVHHGIRPDLFKGNTTKYTRQELELLLTDEDRPVFVYEAKGVVAYAFCQISEVRNHGLLQDVKTLYIDDLCVDEEARGQHIGKEMYEYVRKYARAMHCHNITLNVWEGNVGAYHFYKSMGMRPQKTTMETLL